MDAELYCAVNMVSTQATSRKLVPEGVHEQTVSVLGHSVRYLVGGSGPPVVFIHGLLGFSFSWSENLGVLARHFRVIAPDMPNLGYSERYRSDCTLAGHAA